MSLLNMLSGWQWALLALVPPAIIALYFLKLKRQPLEVPSTFLWRKSIEDLHVNSLWQKMRQNILLLLQLLLLLLVAIALLRPYWQSTELVGERFVLMIDNSASMNSADVEPTRLDDAKRRAREMIEGFSGSSAMVIVFSDTPQVVQNFTKSRRELLRAIDSIQPTNRSTSIDEALRLAAGQANEVMQLGESGPDDDPLAEPPPTPPPTKLYIFSDGRFKDVENFSLGRLEPVYVAIGEKGAANLGITALSTQRNEERPDKLQVFARIENSGDEDAEATAELSIDGAAHDVKGKTIPKRGNAGIVFEIDEQESAVLHLKLSKKDALRIDDEAWCAVNPPQRSRVLLVTPGNPELESALGTRGAAALAEVSKSKPDVLETPVHQAAAAAGTYDLIIYDGCAPKTMPQANTLFLGRMPPDTNWSAGEKVGRPVVIDVDDAHPLMQLVELGDVEIAEGSPLTPPQGATRLIESNKGLLFAVASREGFEDAVLSFGFFAANEAGDAVYNTTWPIRQSFPVFAHNVLQYFGGNRELLATGNVKPGKPVRVRGGLGSSEVVVERPDGRKTTVPRGRHGQFHFQETEQPGPYSVYDGGELTQQFAVNLFDSQESDVAPRTDEKLKIGYVEVAAEEGLKPSRSELWKWLVMAGLAVLLAEWYIYNRRVSI